MLADNRACLCFQAAHLTNCLRLQLEDEFSSAPLAWMQAKKNVHFVTAKNVAACGGDVLAALDAAMTVIPSAKALLLSCVSYMDGHNVDLVRAGALCRSVHVWKPSLV